MALPGGLEGRGRLFTSEGVLAVMMFAMGYGGWGSAVCFAREQREPSLLRGLH